MVRALAYTFSTLGMDIWAQIGRGKSGLVPLTVSRPLGHQRLCVGALGCRDKVEGSRQGALQAAPSNLKPHSSIQTQENSEVGLMVCSCRVYKKSGLGGGGVGDKAGERALQASGLGWGVI